MNKYYKITASTAFIFFFAGIQFVMAQKDTIKLKKEVEVVKAYEPTIQEVQKINDIPQIKPEQAEPPTFEYSIFSKPVFTTFDPTPVAAAKMVGEPRPELENGMLKLGLGNYETPYGELFFNTRPGKNSNFGLHFSHLSSSGKVKLLNDDKIKAPESNTSGEVFAEKFFKRATLSGGLSFEHKSFNYYGYTGPLLSDEEKEAIIPWYQKKQYFLKGSAFARLKSETVPQDGLHYDFRAQVHYLESKTGQKENEFSLSGNLIKKFEGVTGLLDGSFVTYNADSIKSRFSAVYRKRQQSILSGTPSVMWAGDVASLQLGLNITIAVDNETDSKFYVFPKMKAEWSPVPKVLTLFANADGYLKHNTYSLIAAENPFVDPYHDVANSNFKYIVSGGFKGKLTPRTNYIAKATYSKIKDQHFYVLNAVNYSSTEVATQLNNTFDWVYDDVKVLKITGEILHSVSDKFSLHILGNYYSYQLTSLEEPWQMPNYDVTLSGLYRPSDKLKFTLDVFAVGKRDALINSTNSTVIAQNIVNMDSFVDMNLGTEYFFLNNLSFFLKLNNFAFQRYEQMPGYTSKSFNFLTGISFKF
jgi:hypothetical protein